MKDRISPRRAWRWTAFGVFQHEKGHASRSKDRPPPSRDTKRRPAAQVAGSARVARAALFGIAAAASIWLAAIWPAGTAHAQTSECELIPDVRNLTEKILRCGNTLTVRTAIATLYHPIDQRGHQQPKALQLDTGALEIEFHPSKGRRDFQILTPYAIAAVRGTKWVVDVMPGAQTSTLVISGAVAVSRPDSKQTVVLKPGEGADVSPGSGPIIVKRWPEARVRALLARFGE